MPSLEDIETIAPGTPPPATDNIFAYDEQPTREISQTDHINKRLLKSLLDFMNSAAPTPESQAEANGSAEDEFED